MIFHNKKARKYIFKRISEMYTFKSRNDKYVKIRENVLHPVGAMVRIPSPLLYYEINNEWRLTYLIPQKENFVRNDSSFQEFCLQLQVMLKTIVVLLYSK